MSPPLVKSVFVARTVVTDCQQGVEVGFSSPLLHAIIEDCLLAFNGVGLRCVPRVRVKVRVVLRRCVPGDVHRRDRGDKG
jgi:hypothetical protein